MTDGEIRDRIIDKVKWCKLVIAKRHPTISIPPIKVSVKYFSKEYTGYAALAYYDTNELHFSLIYARNYTDRFIAQTVPHEVCHLLAYWIYKDAGRGHGMYWRKLMFETFGLFPHVTHIYGAEHIFEFKPDDK